MIMKLCDRCGTTKLLRTVILFRSANKEVEYTQLISIHLCQNCETNITNRVKDYLKKPYN